MGDFCCCGTVVVSGGDCGGAARLKISDRCFKADVLLYTSVVSGIVGVWLIRSCVRSNAA